MKLINIKSIALVLSICATCVCFVAHASIPHLKKNGNATQLMVHDKPFLMLAAELHNSSASGHEYMQKAWPTFKQHNLNTILAPISWELFEPEEGRFDYSCVDSLIINARKHNIKLGLLWFGSWKNGVSSYVPLWMKKDTKRFFRAKNAQMENMEVVSPFSDEARKADIKAFRALMKHIKNVDSKHNTVVIMQVQNEVGLFAPRDFNDIVTAQYESNVPSSLIKYMQRHKGKGFMNRYFEQSWIRNGAKTSGTWPQLFGYTPESFEFLMAWQYASYIDEIAKAGKEEYPLPMFVNAWLVNDPSFMPGTYPCGGPVSRVMDVYKVAAPAIDFLAPDIYRPFIKEVCKEYHRSDNPLFIPEHKNDALSSAANAVWAIAEHDALGFSPFGIESMVDNDKLLAGAYGMLDELTPLIMKYQGTGKMKGILLSPEDKDATTTNIKLGGHNIRIKYERDFKPVYGLIIQTADDEFIIAGNGFEALFLAHDNGKNTMVGIMHEVRYKDGTPQVLRTLNGDETCGNGARVVNYYYDKSIPAKPLIVRVKTYQREK